MRSAVVDLGSHSFHALVADVDGYGVRCELFDRKVVTRVADASLHEIPRDAYVRGLAAFDDLFERMARRAPDRLRVVATGVFRDAVNGARFLADAGARNGVAIDLLDGAEEARLTWLGVSTELAGSHGRLAVIDLGGGSLELVAGTTHGERAHSFPLGALRLRHLPAAEVRRTVAAVASGAIADVRDYEPDTVVIASGTARALLALARRLGIVGKLQRHVSARAFGELARRLAPLSPEAIESLGVSPARSDSIAAGAITLAAVLEQLGRPVVYVARSALREGVLIELARNHVELRAAS